MTEHHIHDGVDTTPPNPLRQSLNECQAQCAQMQQEITGLLYAISHDLRAPLRAISGFSQALKEHVATTLDTTGMHFLQRIEQSSQRMSQLIDALLSLSRLAQADLISMNIDLGVLGKEVINEVAKRYPQHQPRITIASPLPARGDARLLKEVLLQLLDNAYKCTLNHSNAHIEIGSSEQENKTVFYVRDNGIGFDMSLSGKLFIPFQQLHGREDLRGQGLGLACVQRIIARHGGRIWAQAAPQQGAQFLFCLANPTD